MAVDRYVLARIKASDGIVFSAPDVGIEDVQILFDGRSLSSATVLDQKTEKLFCFARNAMQVALSYLEEIGLSIRGFYLLVDSQDTFYSCDKRKIKVGVGGSAAVVVAIIKSILVFHGFDVEGDSGKIILFKLACIAHFNAQGKVGSCCDVAASVYGTTIHYKSFDTQKIKQKILGSKLVREIVESDWPLLEISALPLKNFLKICIGFSGVSASTKDLVCCVNGFKKVNSQEYFKIISQLNSVVLKLTQAVGKKDLNWVRFLVDKNRLLLLKLSDLSECCLETREISRMIEISNSLTVPAKFSGAGGGDCIIAVCLSYEEFLGVKKAWEMDGFFVLDCGIL
jgi:phosphomevalonate kinase